VPHLGTCIFLIFYNEPELGAEINPGMVLTPFPSSIVLDKIRTHDLSIVSQVCLPLDRTFALYYLEHLSSEMKFTRVKQLIVLSLGQKIQMKMREKKL